MSKIIEIVINNRDKLGEVFQVLSDKAYADFSIWKLNNSKTPSATSGRNFIIFIYEVARALDNIDLIHLLREENNIGLNAKYKNEKIRDEKAKALGTGIALVERAQSGWIEKYYGKG